MASVSVRRSNYDGTLYIFYFGFILIFKGFNSPTKLSQTMSDERGGEKQKLRNSLGLYGCRKGNLKMGFAFLTENMFLLVFIGKCTDCIYKN